MAKLKYKILERKKERKEERKKERKKEKERKKGRKKGRGRNKETEINRRTMKQKSGKALSCYSWLNKFIRHTLSNDVFALPIKYSYVINRNISLISSSCRCLNDILNMKYTGLTGILFKQCNLKDNEKQVQMLYLRLLR